MADLKKLAQMIGKSSNPDLVMHAVLDVVRHVVAHPENPLTQDEVNTIIDNTIKENVA